MTVDKQDALLHVSRIIATHKDLGPLFQALTGVLQSVIQFDVLYILLYDPSSDEMSCVAAPEGTLPAYFDKSVRFQEGPAWEVWSRQESLKFDSKDQYLAFPKFAEANDREHFHIESSCIVPLTSARRRLGVLHLASKRTCIYTDQEVHFIEQVARQVALSVDNALNYEKAQQSKEWLEQERNRLRMLLDVTNATVSKLDIKDLVSEVAQVLGRVLGIQYTDLFLYDKSLRTLRLEIVHFPGGSYQLAPEAAERLVDAAPWSRVITDPRPFILDRARLHMLAEEDEIAVLMVAEGMRAACVVPLVTHGEFLGVLTVARASKDTFTSHEADLLQEIIKQVSVAADNALAYREISQLKDKLSSEKLYLEEEIRSEHNFGEIISKSVAMNDILAKVEIVAKTDSTVLICGETGVGKELIAHAIHDLSARKNRAMVKFNCSAIPSGLLESELFGHERGAFTGASAQRTGRMELAHQGTLFLDEIGELPLELQPKFLRVLQEREFERLGANRVIHVDIRVIAATNRNLETMVADRQFRSDLFYRLNIFPIVIPPLRDRREDIPALVRHFTQKYARKMNRHIDSIPFNTMRMLVDGHWPGNVRELQNVIERAVILSTGSALLVPPGSIPKQAAPEPEPAECAIALPQSAGESEVTEREKILRALLEANCIMSGPKGAAAKLGLRPAVLLSKMLRFGISLDEAQTVPTMREDAASTDDLKTSERELISRVLHETNGVIGGERGAATRLGIKRTTLISRMARLGISRDGASAG